MILWTARKQNQLYNRNIFTSLVLALHERTALSGHGEVLFL